MIFVDSNVFVIDLRYRRDANYAINRSLLDRLLEEGKGATTVVNLLEIAGILSFNLNEQQLAELVVHFPRKYGVRVLPAFDRSALFPRAVLGDLLDYMRSGSSFGDVLVRHEVEQYATADSVFVSWNASHFEAMSVPALTPPEWLGAGGVSSS